MSIDEQTPAARVDGVTELPSRDVGVTKRGYVPPAVRANVIK